MSNWPGKTLKSGTSPEPLSTNSARGKGNDPPLRKKRESDFVKPGFVWTYAHYLTLIFHTLCRGGVLLSGVRVCQGSSRPTIMRASPGNTWRLLVWCCIVVHKVVSAYNPLLHVDARSLRRSELARARGVASCLLPCMHLSSLKSIHPSLLPMVGARVGKARCMVPRAKGIGEEGVYESESMLLEAKQQISHIGDVENIANFVKMLRIAKDALIGSLESSEGRMSEMSVSLIKELSLVNPLSQPARDELICRRFKYLSSPGIQNSPFQLGATVSLTLTPPPSPQPGEASANSKKKTQAPKNQFGALLVTGAERGPGGGVVVGGTAGEVAGTWASTSGDTLSFVCGVEEETSRSLRVMYLVCGSGVWGGRGLCGWVGGSGGGWGSRFWMRECFCVYCSCAVRSRARSLSLSSSLCDS